MQKHIYIVFSSTPYKIGKTIRILTGHKYNHVSIALDPDYRRMYSFARRYYRTPFYGGFVQESLSRYDIGGKRADIRVFQLPLSEEDYHKIENRTAQMLRRQEIYLYNYLSVLGTPFHRSIPTKAAYTCVEFCAHILSMAGFAVNPRQYHTLKDLQDLLQPYLIYTGPIPPSEEWDANFFSKKPTSSPLLITARDFLRLVPRIDIK